MVTTNSYSSEKEDGRSLYSSLLTQTLASCAILVIPTFLVLVILYTSSTIGGESWITASRNGSIPQGIATTLSEGGSCFERKAHDVKNLCHELRVDRTSESGLVEKRSEATFVPLSDELPASLAVGERNFDTSALKKSVATKTAVNGFVAADEWVALVIYRPSRNAVLVKDVTMALLKRVSTSSAAETELWASGQSRHIAGTWMNQKGEPQTPEAQWVSETRREVKLQSPYVGYRARTGDVTFADGSVEFDTFSATITAPKVIGYPSVDIVISVPTDVMLKYTNYAIIAFVFMTLILSIVIALVLRRAAKRHLMPLSFLAQRVNRLREGQEAPGSNPQLAWQDANYEVRQLVDAVDRLERQMEENQELAAKLEAEQKAVQQSTLNALHEKETLLKEIHHRVKNNLQVISSLLSLQMAEISDPNARELLVESVQRVRSMALIHQQLYGIESLSHINLPKYTEQLVRSLQAALCPTAKLEFSGTALDLDIHQAIPVALIINEFVTNALKYGITDRRPDDEGRPDVLVSLAEADNVVEIKVTDFGCALPEDFNPEKSTGLGLKLVRSLTRQLRGELVVSSKDRTSFGVRFKRQTTPR